MMGEELQIGDPVWAKMKGYPPWPAKLARPPPDVETPKGKHFVYFFGSKNTAWVPEMRITPHNEQKLLNSASRKRIPPLQNAVDALIRYSKTYKGKRCCIKLKIEEDVDEKPPTNIIKATKSVSKIHVNKIIEDLRIGDPVWAKMKGYPPWPAKLARPPPDVETPKGKHFVYFFGSNNCAWIPDMHIMPHNEQKFLNSVSKRRISPLQNAVDALIRYSKTYKRKRPSCIKVKIEKYVEEKPPTNIIKVKTYKRKGTNPIKVKIEKDRDENSPTNIIKATNGVSKNDKNEMFELFRIGDLVWAKMKGYPAWPAKLVRPPPDVETPKGKHFVYFFGSDNCAWIPDMHINPLSTQHLLDSVSKKRIPPLQNALNAAVRYSTPYQRKKRSISKVKSKTNRDRNPHRKIIEAKSTVSNKLGMSVFAENSPIKGEKKSFGGLDGGATYPHTTSRSSNVEDKIAEKSQLKSKEKSFRDLDGGATYPPSTSHFEDKIAEKYQLKSKEKSFRDLDGGAIYPPSTARTSNFEDKIAEKPHKKNKEKSFSDLDGGTTYPPLTSRSSHFEEKIDEKSHIKSKEKSFKDLDGGSIYLPSPSRSSNAKDKKSVISYELDDVPVYASPSTTDTSCTCSPNTQPSSLQFGFIGLGVIGGNIVRILIQSGYDISLWNRTEHYSHVFFSMGAKRASSPAELIVDCDVSFCCLSDPEALKYILFAQEGILEGMVKASKLGKRRRGFVNMTTTDPHTSIGIGEAVKSRGGIYLEAALWGTTLDAVNGTLLVVASGDKALFSECESCFNAIGRLVYFMGEEYGKSSTINLIQRTCFGTLCAALAEGMATIDRQILQKEDFLQCLEYSLENMSPIYEEAKMMAKQSFHRKTALKHVKKDMQMGLQFADSLSQPMPVTAAANEVYKNAKVRSFSELDVSAIYAIVRNLV